MTRTKDGTTLRVGSETLERVNDYRRFLTNKLGKDVSNEDIVNLGLDALGAPRRGS